MKKQLLARSLQRACSFGVLVSLVILVGVSAGRATDFIVENTNDSGPGSLRDAIGRANSITNPAYEDRITFATRGIIRLETRLPTLAKDLIIIGPGAGNLVLSGQQSNSLLLVQVNARVVVAGLTLADGFGASGGGAITSLGLLTLQSCLLTNNTANNEGGAIWSQGSLVLDGCTFVSNSVVGLAGRSTGDTNDPPAEAGFEGLGGALFCESGNARLTNCTFSGNSAIGGKGGNSIKHGGAGAGGGGWGGGIYFEGGLLVLVNCTLTGNRAEGGTGGTVLGNLGPPGADGYGVGGGYFSSPDFDDSFIDEDDDLDDAHLLNTIIAGNSAATHTPDLRGSIVSMGGNLVGNTNGMTAIVLTSDIVNITPILGPLQDNGGPVPTHAISMNSPALDAGVTTGVAPLDARGVVRPQGQGVDIGAYEWGNQSITFPPIPDTTYGAVPFELNAASSSVLPVTFTIISGPARLSPTNRRLLSITGAGAVTVVASQPGNELYVPAPSVTNSFIVRPANLLVSAPGSVTRAYGEANPVFSGTNTGLVYNDRIVATFISSATTNTPAGVYGPASPYAITPQLSDPDGRLVNYSVISTTGSLIITKATLPLYVTANNASRPYGAANPVFTGSLINVLNGDNITASFISIATTNTPAGVHGPATSSAITPQLSDPDSRLVNYTVVSTAGTLTITKAVLVVQVTANNASRPYGAANPVFTGSLVNVVNGDNITAAFISTATTNTPAGVYGPGSPYAIVPQLTDPNGRLVNYAVISTTGTLTITKAALALQITANGAARLYGAANPVFTGCLSNVINGDDITAAFISTATTNTPAGVYGPGTPYAIVPQIADPNGRLVNYTVVSTAGTLTITKAALALQVTANGVSRPYGAANPVFTGSLSNVINGDNITATFISLAAANTPAGVYGPGTPYAIVPQIGDPNGRLVNYTVVSTAGTLTITKAALVVQVTANNASRPYGAANPVFTGSLSNVLNGDNITATFISVATTNTSAGVYGPGTPYAIVPQLADPDGRLVNYTVISTAATLTITKAALALQVTANNASRPYGADNPVFTGSLSNVLNGDSITATFISVATTNTPAGIHGPASLHAIVPQLADPNGRLVNYTVISTAGTLTITKAALALQVTANNASRPYGAANPVFTGSLSNVLNGDSITATFISVATTNTPAGIHGPASPDAIVPQLADPNGRLVNYTVISTAGTLTITKAVLALQVTANNASRIYGAANPVFTGSLSNVINGDNIRATFISVATTYTPAGVHGPASPYAIVPQLADPDGRLVNYTVISTAGTLTITKAALALYVTANNASRPYGAANAVFTGSLSNVLNGDNITAAFISVATTYTPAGIYGSTSRYAITPQLADPDGRLVNYTVIASTGTLTITKAALALQVTANNASRPYGAANPVFTGSVSNVVNGDNITATFISAATSDTPAGVHGPASPYGVTPQLADPNGLLVNYTVISTAGTLTITKAALALYVTANNASRYYGAANPVFTGSLSNVLNGDNITATFISAATTSTPAGVYGPASSHAITPQIADPNGRLVNYTVIPTTGTLTITKAALALYVTADHAMKYCGDTNPIFTGTFSRSNLLNGDNITATFVSAATTNTWCGVYGPSTPYAIVPLLADPDGRLPNYNVVSRSGVLTIDCYIPPAVYITRPADGSVFLLGMDIQFDAEVFDPHRITTNVYFLSGTNRWYTPLPAPPMDYFLPYVTISDLPGGQHRFTAGAMDNIGQTSVSDEVNITVVTNLPTSAGPIITNGLEVFQTGLYWQDCWFTNPTPVTLEAVRIEVRGLTNAWLWNLTGRKSGGYVPYIVDNTPLGPGEARRVRLEYYVLDGAIPAPVLSAWWHQSDTPASPGGTLVAIGRIQPFANDTVLLDFTTLSNRTYYIQYSSDVTKWNTSFPALTGKGGVQQWLDYGPPVTTIHPANAPRRFYRLLLVPNH